MSQSVKLKDGSYIDASGVWDNDRQETVEDALKCSTVDLSSYFLSGCSGISAYAMRQGKMVSLICTAKYSGDTIAVGTTLFTLPEGYRPCTQVTVSWQDVFKATIMYSTLHTDGTFTTESTIASGGRWCIATSYLTD